MTDPQRTRRRRITLIALAVVTVASGLIVHSLADGMLGDVAGDALYSVLVYLLAAIALPRVPRALPALVAIAFCTGVELLQLTGIPVILAGAFPPASLVLGSGFDMRDLVVYTVAAVAASAVDAALSLAASRRHPVPETTEGALPKESAL